MNKTVLIGIGSHLMEIIHIQLNNSYHYLSHKRRVFVVFEVFGEYCFRELVLIDHHEAYSSGSPFDNQVIFGFLESEERYLEHLIGFLEKRRNSSTMFFDI